MQIINRGAEAILYTGEFDGKKVLVKERVKKKYRIAVLDGKIRKSRMREEIKLLSAARGCGVPTPQIVHTDEKANKIFMEFVEGIRVKELLSSSKKSEAGKICRDIGKLVGKLHETNIIHGDLTTSNMILKDGKIFFIDFGLGSFSKKIEDKGIDLKLFSEALKSTHFKIFSTCWENFVAGYKTEYKDAERVLKQLGEIEKRVRYVEREPE